MTPTFAGEIQLAGWSDTHTGGCKVTFWLQSQEDLDVFKALTTRKGNTAGHRFMAALVEIGDDEQPVQPVKDEVPKGGPLSQAAAMLEHNPEFLAYAASFGHKTARDYVLKFCGIETRKLLDSDEAAAMFFHNLMRNFNEYRRQAA